MKRWVYITTVCFAIAIPLAILFDVNTREVDAEIKEVTASTTPRTVQLIVVPTKIDWSEPGRIETEIRKVFHEAPNTAVAVAKCESSLKMVQSHHMQPYGREESFGIFQIHARAHENTAVRLGLEDYKTDPGDNIKLARKIYDAAGKSFSPWTCYTKGMI